MIRKKSYIFTKVVTISGGLHSFSGDLYFYLVSFSFCLKDFLYYVLQYRAGVCMRATGLSAFTCLKKPLFFGRYFHWVYNS